METKKSTLPAAARDQPTIPSAPLAQLADGLMTTEAAQDAMAFFQKALIERAWRGEWSSLRVISRSLSGRQRIATNTLARRTSRS